MTSRLTLNRLQSLMVRRKVNTQTKRYTAFGLPEFEAKKMVIHLSGVLQYPDKKCPEIKACSTNSLISGNLISELL